MRKFLLLLLSLTAFIGQSDAQVVGLKSNLLYSATASPNLGVEIGMGPQTTIDISAGFNPFKFSNNRQWRHWLVQPEARYWFCERFSRHFIGVHALGGQYNFGGLQNNISFLGTDFSKLTDSRYQGWAAGAGVAYGYAFILGKHWNLELELGVGYIYANYDIFSCAGCGRNIGAGDHHYFGPTKAAVNLVYLF